MRRIIALALAGAALAALTGGTAVAAKPKKVRGTFGATLAPFPKLAAAGDPIGVTKPGCTAGQEGVNWVGQEFTSPGKGTLRFYTEGFTGDHDLYVFQGDQAIAASEQPQVPDGAPPEEEINLPLKKGQKVTLVACNWLGQPQVEAHYEGQFK